MTTTQDEQLKQRVLEERLLFEKYEKQLLKIEEKMNRISLSEFTEYLPLYQTQPNEDDENYISHLQLCTELSAKLKNRINVFADIHIVDDNDPTKIIAVLPKIYVPLVPIHKDHAKVCSTFDTVLLHASERKDLRTLVTEELMAAIASSQELTKEKVNNIVAETTEKAIKAMQALTGKSPMPVNTTNSSNTSASSVPDKTTVSVTFDFDTED